MATADRADSIVTLVGLGALAYVCETVGHELLGHGSACLLSGGQISALAPLFMRCSVDSIPMVAAGPAFNLFAAGVFALIIQLRPRGDALTYFLWLSCAFNLLVACGYLIGGGATTFGDWGVVFASTAPQWFWRLAVIIIGLGGYVFGLWGLAQLYAKIAGLEGFNGAILLRRTLLPGISAAIVACTAELAGGRLGVASLPLVLGCTLFVGWSLSRIGQFRPGTGKVQDSKLVVPFSSSWLIAATIASLIFVGFLGPVALQPG